MMRACWMLMLSSVLLTLALHAAELRGQEPASAPKEPPSPQPAMQPGPMDMFIAFSRAQLGVQGFERRQAEVEGRRFVWWQKDSGQEGTGQTLILIHGVNDQAGTWFQITPALTERLLAEDLSAEKYRVLLVDLPGHGESAPQSGTQSGPLPMSTVLGGFEAWLQTKALAGEDDRAILVGNSMGAWIAVLAARDLPDRVARIVLTNGGPLRPDTGDYDLLPADREEARRLMAVLRDPSSLATPDMVLDDLVRRAPRSQVSRMFEAREDLDSHLLDVEALARVATPVDLLWGASDRYLGAEYPSQLDAALPASRLTFVETCGHLPQVECPQRYVAQLLDVLRSPAPQSPAMPAPALQAEAAP